MAARVALSGKSGEGLRPLPTYGRPQPWRCTCSWHHGRPCLCFLSLLCLGAARFAPRVASVCLFLPRKCTVSTPVCGKARTSSPSPPVKLHPPSWRARIGEYGVSNRDNPAELDSSRYVLLRQLSTPLFVAVMYNRGEDTHIWSTLVLHDAVRLAVFCT
jgi:hypothetical protein